MAQKSRVAIHGVPRSGTTWLGQILNSSPQVLYKFQPLFSYELKGYLNDCSALQDIDSFFHKLEHTSADYLDQTKDIRNGLIPPFKKDQITHIVYKEVRYHHIVENLLRKDAELRVIGIVRNPLAVINSWLRTPREFRADLGWDFLKEWRWAERKNQSKPEEFFGFEKWKESTELFERLAANHPGNFLVVRYDDLLQNTESVTREIFQFCQLSVSAQTLEFIRDSRSSENVDPYSVFKTRSKDDQWVETLDRQIAHAIETELNDTPYAKYLGPK